MRKQLPKNWVEATIPEFITKDDIFIDGDWIETKDQDPEGQVRLIQLADIGAINFRDKSNRFMNIAKAKRLNCTFLKQGDILIARMPDPIGRACIFPLKGENVTVVDVAIIRPYKPFMSNKLLMYFINSPQINNEISNLASGSTRQRVSRKNLGTIKFPIPPLAEQNRIVAKLDTLFTQLETIKTNMGNIPILLKDFRQQVLTQAITGKLTAEWRKGKELKSIIFLEIEREREKLKKLKSLKDGKKSFTYKKAICPIVGVTTKGIDDLFKLPNNWSWVSLDQVTWNISDGPHFSPSYSDSIKGKRFISMRNITPQGINFEGCKYVSIEDHNEFIKRGRPEEGDLLYTKGGSTGIPCLIDDDTDFSYWVHVALLKTISKFIDSKYLRNTLLSPLCYKQSQAFTHGVGNQDLGLTRMINITFPLPPIAEQQEIVHRVESLFAKADAIEQQYKSLKGKIDALPQALLHKAFKGELTEQLGSDGDAKELLQQIQELKGATTKVAKNSKLEKLKSFNKKLKSYPENEIALGVVAESK